MNRLLTLVLINLSLIKVDFVVTVSTNSSRGNSEEQPTTPTFPDYSTLPPSTGPFSCPCSLDMVIAILGYSPCSIHNFISPRECDAFVQVALRKAFLSLLDKVDLHLFNNYCFFPFPFNEDQVIFFN